ncbi:hypothetical protein SLE2022_273860 [Rubroshorea leprosula]
MDSRYFFFSIQYTGMEKKVREFQSLKMGLLSHHQFQDRTSQFVFLDIPHQETGAIGVDHSLSFSTKSHVQIISCCREWLLLSTLPSKKRDPKYHVFNPLEMVSFTLPPPLIAGKIIASGLGFDDKHRYHVVLFHLAAGADGFLELEIFTSKVGEWRTYDNPINVSPLFPALEDRKAPTVTNKVLTWLNQRLGIKRHGRCLKEVVGPVFSDGAIYWVINGQMLAYRLQDGSCELIELPNPDSIRTYQHSLWESGGRLQYSCCDDKGIHTWDLLNKEDHDRYLNYHIYDQQIFRWKLAYSVDQEKLGLGKWEPYLTCPVAFIDDLQTMYLQLPGVVISYNTGTQVMKQVCTIKSGGRNSIFSFSYAGLGNQEVASRPREAVPVNLPIALVEQTFCFE